ncbi:UPF0481 protein At3g47200 [Setaria viridis]|nr:uncharacterized protein LOC117859911 [Setaria viridis]
MTLGGNMPDNSQTNMEDQQERPSSDPRAVFVDIPSPAQALEHELVVRRRHRSSGSQPCTPTIGVVHDLTRNVDEQEYNPHYVSIGPYHRKRNPSIIREDDKLTSLETILSASCPGATVQTYLDELALIEGRARSFYAHSFSEMNSMEFLRMLLLDACYVLDWFGNFVPDNISPAANLNSSPASAPGDGSNIIARENNGSPVANGQVEGSNQASSTASAAGGGNKLEAVLVVRDVFYLAENQIPFFVIDKVHSLSCPGRSVPAVKAIARYVSRCILQKQQYSMATVEDGDEPPGNLLHLLHQHFSNPTTEPYSAAGETVGRCRTAMEYYINGVNFSSRPVGTGAMEARCILDVTMDHGSGTLVLPRLRIDAQTWRILRNLMALEQQNQEVGSHVTAYCTFMSQLACTARDVELLSRSGVIVHLLGNNKEVAKLFADLCKGIVFDADDTDHNYLRATCQALNELYRSRPRRWMALLVQKYSDNPWLVVGVIAAALGLLCTMVQAIYAVLSYHPGAAN